MSFYRRARSAINAFRSLSTKIPTGAPLQQPTSRLLRHASSSTPKMSGFSSFSSFSTGVGRRYYYVDRYRVQHFKPRGPRRWIENPRIMMMVVLVGSGVVITLYFGNLETIPYTKRTHFVLLSRAMEKQMGEEQFKQVKASYKGKLLPAIHPDSVRIRLISKEIIEALQRGLRQETVWTDLGYASTETDSFHFHDEKGAHETMKAIRGDGEGKIEGKWSREDELLDDKWVQNSRKKGQEKGLQATTSHLDGLNWEVLVVNEPIVNAFCMPGGKIVVFTGLLEHFNTDEEIATIIGHEVGHAVARHTAETITKNLWFAILQLLLYQFVDPHFVNTMSNLLLRLPFSRKMEMEADYIGLLLLASAGYDPRIAPKVYEKLGKIGGDLKIGDYLSTHPSGKKRAQVLAEAKVMQEALDIYREVKSGYGVEGFL